MHKRKTVYGFAFATSLLPNLRILTIIGGTIGLDFFPVKGLGDDHQRTAFTWEGDLGRAGNGSVARNWLACRSGGCSKRLGRLPCAPFAT